MKNLVFSYLVSDAFELASREFSGLLHVVLATYWRRRLRDIRGKIESKCLVSFAAKHMPRNTYTLFVFSRNHLFYQLRGAENISSFMSGRWSCATLGAGVAAVAAESAMATPESEELELLKQIEEQNFMRRHMVVELHGPIIYMIRIYIAWAPYMVPVFSVTARALSSF